MHLDVVRVVLRSALTISACLRISCGFFGCTRNRKISLHSGLRFAGGQAPKNTPPTIPPWDVRSPWIGDLPSYAVMAAYSSSPPFSRNATLGPVRLFDVGGATAFLFQWVFAVSYRSVYDASLGFSSLGKKNDGVLLRLDDVSRVGHCPPVLLYPFPGDRDRTLPGD